MVLLLRSCIDITKDVSHWYKRVISDRYNCPYATFESVAEVPGWDGAPASGLRGVPSAASLTSHVPGMRATGKIQVAVKTIPWPIQNQC
jgi:hypothetical protein